MGYLIILVDFISKIWIWDWGKETFTSISTFIGGLVILVIGLILFKHIIMALSAPFMSPVSEKIEAHLTGNAPHSHRDTTFLEQLMRGIRINGRNLLWNSINYSILTFKIHTCSQYFLSHTTIFVQAYYAGFGNMDYTLERHYKYKESVQFVRKNRGLAIGNGIVFILFLLIPIIGVILVLPLSVTAATVKTVHALELKNNTTYGNA